VRRCNLGAPSRAATDSHHPAQVGDRPLGSPCRSHDVPGELCFPGFESTSAYRRERKGNGVAQGFTRTLKEQPLGVPRLGSVAVLLVPLPRFGR